MTKTIFFLFLLEYSWKSCRKSTWCKFRHYWEFALKSQYTAVDVCKMSYMKEHEWNCYLWCPCCNSITSCSDWRAGFSLLSLKKKWTKTGKFPMSDLHVPLNLFSFSWTVFLLFFPFKICAQNCGIRKHCSFDWVFKVLAFSWNQHHLFT